MSPIKLISGFCGAVLLLTIIIAAYPKRSPVLCLLIIEEEQSVDPIQPPAVEPEHE